MTRATAYWLLFCAVRNYNSMARGQLRAPTSGAKDDHGTESMKSKTLCGFGSFLSGCLHSLRRRWASVVFSRRCRLGGLRLVHIGADCFPTVRVLQTVLFDVVICDEGFGSQHPHRFRLLGRECQRPRQPQRSCLLRRHADARWCGLDLVHAVGVAVLVGDSEGLLEAEARPLLLLHLAQDQPVHFLVLRCHVDAAPCCPSRAPRCLQTQSLHILRRHRHLPVPRGPDDRSCEAEAIDVLLGYLDPSIARGHLKWFQPIPLHVFRSHLQSHVVLRHIHRFQPIPLHVFFRHFDGRDLESIWSLQTKTLDVIVGDRDPVAALRRLQLRWGSLVMTSCCNAYQQDRRD
mmetsp:Transcript_1466/g.3284  ORF Transcript_1466/g.3284 Transcript_1466/m.3284 type:complete len:346 (+) Transcript_1466:42-1079(+)